MPPTLRGVYHNLRESKYTVSNGEIVFFFSSEYYLNKFMNGYKEHREKRNKIKPSELNMNTLFDIEYYMQVEKRGFFARLKRAKVTVDELYRYAVRKMVEKDTLEWVKI